MDYVVFIDIFSFIKQSDCLDVYRIKIDFYTIGNKCIAVVRPSITNKSVFFLQHQKYMSF